MYRYAKLNVILMAGLLEFTIKYYVLESSVKIRDDACNSCDPLLYMIISVVR